MTVLRVGSTKKYAANWEQIFKSSGKRAAAQAGGATVKTGQTSVKSRRGKKKSK